MTEVCTKKESLDAVKRELQRWPSADQISSRDDFETALVLCKLPEAGPARLEALENALATWRNTLAINIARYEQIRADGPAALTYYDIHIAYGGDPVEAVRGSLLLKRNHISYARSAIHAICRAIEQETQQLTLF